MISFELIENNNGVLKYNYRIMDKANRRPGLIVASVEDCLVEMRTMADGDMQRIITAEELNRITDMINAARQQNGEEVVLEYTDEDGVSYLYGDLAMSCIWQALQEGRILENSEGIDFGI